MKPRRRWTIWVILFTAGALLIAILSQSGPVVTARSVPFSTTITPYDTLTYTVHLPLVTRNYPPPSPIEVTQGIQQPDNSVTLIAGRPTFVRLTLTSTVPHANVSAWLHGTRDGAPLPGSPLAAINNPRTLQAVADRNGIDETFNFQLPSSWADGDVTLRAEASNGTAYAFSSASEDFQFVLADPLHVTVVPIAYTCTSGGSGTTTPAPPYDYLTEFTYRTFPVPAVNRVTHASMPYSGPCEGSMPDPTGDDWSNILDAVTDAWYSEGQPNSYYYGLIEITCSGGCICGIGWVGELKAAAGWTGRDAQHSEAGETHAHEVGHNHGRFHAPGCGASWVDPDYPYASGGVGFIGDATHQNFGFDIVDTTLYRYDAYYDFMSYCGPTWISDYTYEAILQEHRVTTTSATAGARTERAWLISGRIDPVAGQASLRPAYALDLPVTPLPPGDYVLELRDASGQIVAAYPFDPVTGDADRPTGGSSSLLGFHLALPYTERVSAIHLRHRGQLLATQKSGGRKPTVPSSGSVSGAGTPRTTITWQAGDPDGDALHYLVRASTDGGATWQVIGVNLISPAISLSPADFGGQPVLIEILASDGLHTTSAQIGPFAVPAP